MRVPVYLRMAGTGILYFLAGVLGLAVPFTSSNVSPVWPASGVALACLLIFGWRCWPAITLAAFLFNYLSPLPALAALGLAIGNTAAALTGVFLLSRIPGFRRTVTGLREMLAIIAAGAIAPLVSASIGTAVLFGTGLRAWDAVGRGWLMYYLGDATGILLVAPLLLAIRDFVRMRSWFQRLESGALLVLTAVVSRLLFNEGYNFVSQHGVLVLLIFPLVLWSAIRFGTSATAAMNLVIAGIAVLATARGVGPFSRDLPFINALLLQLFLTVLSISGLLLSAVITERQHTEQERRNVLASERARAEEQARKHRMELQEVLDNSPAMIYMKDPAGRYIFVNRRWTELLHTTTSDAQGKTDLELFPPEAAQKFVENDRVVVASGQTCQFEEQAVLSDGPHYYDSTKVALRDDQGKVYALCGISMDVTERRLKEESLRQVHRALRVLSQCNAAVVHATEEQALLDEVCRIAVGPAGYQLAWVGYTEHDEACTVRPVASAGPAEGFLDRIHVSWADNEYGRGSIGYAVRENRPVVVRRLHEQATFAVWRDALATRNFDSVLAVPLSEQGSIFGALAIYAEESDAFDSSEVELLAELGRNLAHGIVSLRARKERTEAIAALQRARAELEERVRQRTLELEAARDAAQSADRLKSAFLAVMSHELRTPLNSIIGFTGIVAQELAGPLNEEQKRQLGMVQNSSRHLLALINDVLDISKIEAGQLDIHCSSFSLREVITQAVATVSPLAEKRGIALHAEIPPDAGDILSDQHRTRQILLNLVGNAVKFTDEGSVCVRCICEEPWVTISIQDTGIGIPPQHLKTIFEPFRQVDTGVARSREGTGLGLSICRRLVERLGGFLSVESEPGVGSTFTVRLPRKWEVSRG